MRCLYDKATDSSKRFIDGLKNGQEIFSAFAEHFTDYMLTADEISNIPFNTKHYYIPYEHVSSSDICLAGRISHNDDS